MLHLDDDKERDGDTTLVPFTKRTWTKAKKVAQARRKHQQRSKYLNVCKYFDDKPQPQYGYHSSCYYKFTAFMISEDEKSGETTCSIDDSVEPLLFTTSKQPADGRTGGMLEKKCTCRENQVNVSLFTFFGAFNPSVHGN